VNGFKIKITILVLLSQVALIQGLRLLALSESGPVVKVNPAKTKGSAKAGVKIAEYTDFQCPACANSSRILKEYHRFFPGKIYLEYHAFPLAMHKNAMPIAVAGECAARPRKFWAFHDLAFGRQNLLRETINLPARLSEIAQEAGMNVRLFQACLEDGAVEDMVKADKKKGEALKVEATPTYFVNGKMVVGGQGLARELQNLLGRLP